MTEKEWLASTDPMAMLDFAEDKVSDRKLRLFACACCQLIWDLLPDEEGRHAVWVAELFADGLASEADRTTAEGKAFWLHDFILSVDPGIDVDEFNQPIIPPDPARGFPAAEAAVSALTTRARDAARFTASYAVESVAEGERSTARIHQVHTLHDILGLPSFRRIAVNLTWLRWNGGTVAHLAQAAYDERIMPSGELNGGRLAILADALEDAGCTDAAILDHLRGQGPHVRGCWVVDLLLGKE